SVSQRAFADFVSFLVSGWVWSARVLKKMLKAEYIKVGLGSDLQFASSVLQAWRGWLRGDGGFQKKT
ncbi:hypothetical protein, partial [Brevibacillus parabrevis]|uniref:hypothetical protein n=1 Tax=Brevibacillus parabrevis TaxID=54914 RepID=UPI002491E611